MLNYGIFTFKQLVVDHDADEDRDRDPDDRGKDRESKDIGDGGVGKKFSLSIAAPTDENIVPAMEWWDEAFLAKSLREIRRRSLALANNDDYG